MTTIKAQVIALIGPSGSGKDYIYKKLKRKMPWANFLISTTTRPIRQGEVDGVDYHFVTNEQFDKLPIIAPSQFFVNNSGIWKYGLSLGDIRWDTVNIGVFDPTRVKQLMENKYLNVKVYYIEASAKSRLLRQLTREKEPNVPEIVRRYQCDLDDFCVLPFPHESCVNETRRDAALIVKDIRSSALASLGKGSS